MGTDQVFEQPAARGSFRFNDQVAQVFDNMASRSIPFYQENMRLSTELVRRFAQEGSAVYDLGCSTCTLLIQSAKELNGKEVKLVGYDPSESMRQQAQQKLDYYTYSHDIEVRDGLCQTAGINNASVVVLNYTLQFLSPEDRPAVLKRIYNELRPGGILILAEKVSFEEETAAEYMTDLYNDLKRENGYSELEIAHKREALENILVPWTLQENLAALKTAGFEYTEILLKWCTFTTLVAHKK